MREKLKILGNEVEILRNDTLSRDHVLSEEMRVHTQAKAQRDAARIEQNKLQTAFRDKKVTLMKGDWTNRDPAITHALAAFGRAGVPLYVVYNSKPGSEPLVLPQLLTAGIVHDAFVDAPGK